MSHLIYSGALKYEPKKKSGSSVALPALTSPWSLYFNTLPL